MQSNMEKHAQTFLLSLLTAATLGCFAFLWKVNGNIIVLQQQSVEGNTDRQRMQSSLNDANIRLVDVRERVVRLEANSKK